MTTETRRSVALELLATQFTVKEETQERLLVEAKLTGAALWDFQDVASAVADLLNKEVVFEWNYQGNAISLKPTLTPSESAVRRVLKFKSEAQRLQERFDKLHQEVGLYERAAAELAPFVPETQEYRAKESLRLGQERFETAVRVYVSRALFEGGELLVHLNREATLLWDPDSQLPMGTDQRTANRSLLQSMARKLARLHGATSFTIRDNEDKFLIYDKAGK